MEQNNLEKQIEAVLFWKGEPVSVQKLSKIFEKTEEEIFAVLLGLETKLADRGIVLIRKEDEVALGTSQGVSEIIEKLTKEELVKDLGKAGLETLSIIIYQGPISRAEIDYIRGVQSNFILRNLAIRGLVEKVANPADQRSFLYKPTFELLSYMGVAKIEDMPEFAQAKAEIESYKNAVQAEEKDETVADAPESAKVFEDEPDESFEMPEENNM
jgi:segregation and condensation protein B